MRGKLVLCPETEQLEHIDYLVSPLGLLVAGCTRFGDCWIHCTRSCVTARDLQQEPVLEILAVGDETKLAIRIS